MRVVIDGTTAIEMRLPTEAELLALAEARANEVVAASEDDDTPRDYFVTDKLIKALITSPSPEVMDELFEDAPLLVDQLHGLLVKAVTVTLTKAPDLAEAQKAIKPGRYLGFYGPSGPVVVERITPMECRLLKKQNGGRIPSDMRKARVIAELGKSKLVGTPPNWDAYPDLALSLGQELIEAMMRRVEVDAKKP